MRIALVNPIRVVQMAMTEMIGHGEYELLAFCEGRAALNCLSTDNNVRVLLTSVQLGDISGIELCAAGSVHSIERRLESDQPAETNAEVSREPRR